jgi:monofunctional biosynthetic peptidoglycan transglycosylase
MKAIWYFLGGTALIVLVGLLAPAAFLATGESSPSRRVAPLPLSSERSSQPAIPDEVLPEGQVEAKDERNRMTGKNTRSEAAPSSTIVGKTLFDFDGSGPAWFTVNDDVMGGVSSSIVDTDAEMQRLVFSGDLSLENNGGFASIRSQWSNYDLTGYDGIVLRVLGDGRTYQFRIRAEETGSEIAYAALLETEDGVWKDIYISFEEMVPVFRGAIVRQAPALDPGSIRSFGFMLADRQEGDFSLEVEKLSAVVAGNSQV